MNTAITLLAATPQIHGILLGALFIAILILVLAGLIYLIQRFISPIPPVVLLIVAIVLLIGIAIWAFSLMGISI